MKYKRRPLRIFNKKSNPYIIYKDNKVYLKGSDIKTIIKFINKLQKKIPIKKIDKEKKKNIMNNINKTLQNAIITSTMSSANIQPLINRENEIKNEINKKENKLKQLEIEYNNIENKTEKLLSIKPDEDKIYSFYFANKKYKLNKIEFFNFLKDYENYGKNLYNEYNILLKEKKELENELNKQNVSEINLDKNDDVNKIIKEIENKEEEQQIINKEEEQQIINKEEQQNDKKNKLKEIEKKREQVIEFEFKKKKGRPKKNINEQKVEITKEDIKKNIEQQKKIYNEKDLNEEEKKIYNNIYDDLAINKLSKSKYDRYKQPGDLLLSTKFKYSDIYKKYKNIINNNTDLESDEYNNFQKDLDNAIIEGIKENENIGNGKIYSNKGLYNTDINKIMHPFCEYIGTTTIDDIDTIFNHIIKNNILKGCFIINIKYHWVALYFDFENEYTIEYYDPFGNKYPQYLERRLKNFVENMNINYYIKIKHNSIKNQNSNSNNCGWFCIRFLLFRLNEIPFKDATDFKKNIKDDENNIEKLKDHYNTFGFI